MKKLIFALTLLIIPIFSFGKDFSFVLKCDWDDKKSSSNPFFFIGTDGKYNQIIYLKSNGRIFNYFGGESKILELNDKSIDFYEYIYNEKETLNKKLSISIFTLDRKSLKLNEVLEKNTNNPVYINYKCTKEIYEQKSYSYAIDLKKKYDNGENNKI